MKNQPLDFKEGVTKFLNTYSRCADIVDLVPPCRHIQSSILFSGLTYYGINTPNSRVYRFVPPSNVGYKHLPRIENVPKLERADFPEIIVDEIIHKGTTLNWTIDQLRKQGIPLENIWFCTSTIFGSNRIPCVGFLDRADVFLKALNLM